MPGREGQAKPATGEASDPQMPHWRGGAGAETGLWRPFCPERVECPCRTRCLTPCLRARSGPAVPGQSGADSRKETPSVRHGQPIACRMAHPIRRIPGRARVRATLSTPFRSAQPARGPPDCHFPNSGAQRAEGFGVPVQIPPLLSSPASEPSKTTERVPMHEDREMPLCLLLDRLCPCSPPCGIAKCQSRAAPLPMAAAPAIRSRDLIGETPCPISNPQ